MTLGSPCLREGGCRDATQVGRGLLVLSAGQPRGKEVPPEESPFKAGALAGSGSKDGPRYHGGRAPGALLPTSPGLH